MNKMAHMLDKIIVLKLATNPEMIEKDFITELYKTKDVFNPWYKEGITKIYQALEKNIIVKVEESFDEKYLWEVLKDEEVTRNSYYYSSKDSILQDVKREYVKAQAKYISTNDDTEDIIQKLDNMKSVFEKTQSIKVVDIGKMVNKFFENIDKKLLNNSVKTRNWLRYNKAINMTGGDLIVVAGRPGMGKTAFALSYMLELAKNKSKGIFFSLEMSEGQLMERIISQMSNVSMIKFMNKEDWESITKEEHNRITNACEEIKKEYSPYIDIISGNFSTTDIYNVVEDKKPDYIMIDYLQILKSADRTADRIREITNISIELKRIAMKFDIPVIALSQLSRAVEQRANRRPMLSDLRESGQIEQDSSIVLMLYRDEYYNEGTEAKGEIEVAISKNRNGMLGTILFNFQKGVQRVYENY